MKETIRTSSWDRKRYQTMFGPYRRPASVLSSLMIKALIGMGIMALAVLVVMGK